MREFGETSGQYDSTVEERKVLDLLLGISEYETYDYAPLLVLCEKNEGLYHPVFRVTVLMHILCSYKLKMAKTEGRDRFIYMQSLIAVNRTIKTFLEGRKAYYKEPSNKRRLLRQIVESKIVDKTERVVEESYWITKYIFIDLDGKSHWANSASKRDELKEAYICSFIDNYALEDDFECSSLGLTCKEIVESVRC